MNRCSPIRLQKNSRDFFERFPAEKEAGEKKRWDNSYPYKEKMKRAEYEKLKIELQIELLKVQSWVRESGEKICLLFEGRDAAGKGGTIKRRWSI